MENRICPPRTELINGWSDPGAFSAAEVERAYEAMRCDGAPNCDGPTRVPYGAGNFLTERLGRVLASVHISKAVCQLRLCVPEQPTGTHEAVDGLPLPVREDSEV